MNPMFNLVVPGQGRAVGGRKPVVGGRSVGPALRRWAVLLLGIVGLAGLAGLAGPMRVGAADAAFFGILKSQQYRQADAGAPVPFPSGGFAFNSFVFASTNGAVTNATVDPPGATPVRTLVPDASQAVLRYEERFDTQAALDAAYPNGGLTSSYQMAMRTVNDGVRTAGLNFTIFGLPIGAPPVLQVTTWGSAQSVDHTLELPVRWSGSSGQALDIVQLVVVDALSNTVYSTPAPLSAGALTGQSNSVVIPARALPPGSALTGQLAIGRLGLPNTNSYPGAFGVAAILRVTEFPILTRPAPAPVRLDVVSSGAGAFALRFPAETNRVYRLQASADLAAWSDLLVTNPAVAGMVEWTEALAPAGRFHRVQVGR